MEDQFTVGQATEPLDENGCFVNERITCRRRNETISVDKHQVDYVDVSPKMMVSVATAMIPFLQNDDANRALMGANMQRQAVPLLRPEAPIVATGQEHRTASTLRSSFWPRVPAWSPRSLPGISPWPMTTARPRSIA